MAMRSSNQRLDNQATTLLFNSVNDLRHIQTECKPGFEIDFWQRKILPLIIVLEAERLPVNEKRRRVDFLIQKIEKFRCVYGRVKTIYKILQEVQQRLRNNELEEKPILPKSLEDLSRNVIYMNPKYERILYKSDTVLSDNCRFSFESYFNKFSIIELKYQYARHGYEENFCNKVIEVIKKIEKEKDLPAKLSIALEFLKRCKRMKTMSIRRIQTIKKFETFITTTKQ